jgi:hypothetical protein
MAPHNEGTEKTYEKTREITPKTAEIACFFHESNPVKAALCALCAI